MKRFVIGLLLIVLFGLLALPALAQDAPPTADIFTPEPTAEVTVIAPPDAPPAPPVIDTTELPDYMIVLAGLVVLGVLILFGGVLYVVYNSIPAWGQAGINATIIKAVEQGRLAAAGTPTRIDDAIMDEIARRVSDRLNIPLAANSED